MNADVLTATETDGIAIITLGSVKHIYFDAEMGDALTEALDGFEGGAGQFCRRARAADRVVRPPDHRRREDSRQPGVVAVRRSAARCLDILSERTVVV